MPSSTVSVIIPTYFRNPSLRDAIQSVLDQDYEPIDLVVVDDSGEAHARPVVDDFDEVTYVSFDENRGATAARNRGFAETSGEYVQFLDDDDRLRPDKIRRQVAVLEENADVGAVSCGIRYDTGRIKLPPDDARGDVLRQSLMFDSLWRYSTLLLDRSTVEPVMPLEERAVGAGDAKFGIEVARITRYDFVDEYLVLGGEPDDRLGESWLALNTLKRLLEEYRDLYDQFDPTVRRTAVSDVYALEGRLILREATWSPRAIWCELHAVYYAPPERLPHRVGELLGALAGRVGLRLGSWTLETARSHLHPGERRSRGV